MLLRRLGCKQGLLSNLLPLFPQQITTFIDLFFGSGAVSFAMLPRVKKIIANDADWDVMNLFLVMKDRHEDLLHAVLSMPEHGELMEYWQTHQEPDPVWAACRFLMLSNFGYLGRAGTLKYNAYGEGLAENTKGMLLCQLQNGIKQTIASPKIAYMCCDFREVLSKIHFKKEIFGRPTDAKGEAFIYADPPYCNTAHNYSSGFAEQDTIDLIECCCQSGVRFGISEFESPFILKLATDYDLNVTVVKERQTLKSRNVEILLTNYETSQPQQELF